MATGMFDVLNDDMDMHQLGQTYRFYFVANNDEEESQTSERTESDLHSTPSFSTVEDFWNIYDHLVRPGDMATNFDCCLFREGIKPFPDDPGNKGGGKWTLRLRKGLASRFWEEVVLACIGGAHNIDQDFCGAIVTSRPEEDILSIWSDHRDREGTLRLRKAIVEILSLPKNTVIEYKRHASCLPHEDEPRRYSIQQLQDVRDGSSKDPPLYVWESIEAMQELRPLMGLSAGNLSPSTGREKEGEDNQGKEDLQVMLVGGGGGGSDLLGQFTSIDES